MSRTAVRWRSVNDWAYADPARWGALAGAAWALGWIVGALLYHRDMPTVLLSAAGGGIVFGLIVGLVTRRRSTRQVATSSRPPLPH